MDNPPTDYTLYPSLQGQGVFITGGATGIGAELVRAFCRQRARVAFVDRDDAAAATLCAQLNNDELWYRTVDVTDVDALKRAINDAVIHIGGLYVLINNVANDQRHQAAEINEQGWRDCLSVNLDASFFAAQTALPFLQQQGGSIINFSSINALLGPDNMPGYVAAKSALLGLSKSLAQEWGRFNIRVNALLPGWVVTDRQLAMWLTPEDEEQWMQQVAIQRRLLPQDVAKLALFLAADDSQMITGQALVIDGGRT
jgi:NAD(P)-dependent dehydrogenase (short-subunit alcohol dehydrogenase family)